MEKAEQTQRVHSLLSEIRTVYREILGDKLRGLYVHGSLAFGCFRWDVSDIDFLAVVTEEITFTEKRRLLDWILSVREKCPPKGLEMSVVEEWYCRTDSPAAFVYPTPYLFHWSEGHLARALADPDRYCETMQGTDRDLAAHFTVTRLVGYPIYGPSEKSMFSPVPDTVYYDSLVYDVENMEADIAENPVYCVLNLCRVLAWCRDGEVMSKAEGGRWGQEHLEPQWRGTIGAALSVYETGEGTVQAPDMLAGFARRCLREIQNWKKE